MSTAINQAVAKSGTSIMITTDTNPAIVDQNITLTIAVVPNGAGAGNFSYDGTQFAGLYINGTQVACLQLEQDGTARYVTTLSTPGAAAITASYRGDDDQFVGSQTLDAFEQGAEYYSPPPPPPPPSPSPPPPSPSPPPPRPPVSPAATFSITPAAAAATRHPDTSTDVGADAGAYACANAHPHALANARAHAYAYTCAYAFPCAHTNTQSTQCVLYSPHCVVLLS